MGYPCFELKSQTDSISNSIIFDFYLQPYWGYDFGQPNSNDRPVYFYSYNRHNEVNTSNDAIFTSKIKWTNSNYFAVSSLAIQF
jgi:hypothetical protein